MQTATTDALSSLRTVALDRLAWSRGFTLMLVNEMTDEQLLARVAGRGNHAVWVVGHLAVVDDNLVATLGGRERTISSEFRTLFGPGSQPSENAGDYPSRAELLEVAAGARERLREWVASLDEANAFQPNPSMLRRFSPDRITTPF